MSQVVIANRRSDGIVVFLTGDERWVESIQDCEVAPDEGAAKALLEKGLAAVGRNLVVGAELIAVSEQGGAIVPTRYRELIRSLGPTVRTDLGKQAGN